jgi:signal transduction histidine kinase
VQQVISNLINNSVKYSDSDTEIRVSCHFYPQKSKLHIQVLNNGIGIHHKDAERILKPYTTLPEAQKIAFMGAGLGLYSCKILC